MVPSAGKKEWIYLNERPEQLSGVGLGDFDGDGYCGVFAVHGSSWDISKGGTTLFTSLRSRATPTHPVQPSCASVFRLSALRFGDFDGNGVTDVVSISGGIWSISWDATTTWRPLGASCSLQHSEQALVFPPCQALGCRDRELPRPCRCAVRIPVRRCVLIGPDAQIKLSGGLGVYKFLYGQTKFIPIDSRFFVLGSAPVGRFAIRVRTPPRAHARARSGVRGANVRIRS